MVFGRIQTLISVFTRNLVNKTDTDLFLWPTGNDFPKLFLGVLEFHRSRTSVLEFFLSGNYVIGRAFLSLRAFCRTAALLVLNCSFCHKALTHLQWAVEPV